MWACTFFTGKFRNISGDVLIHIDILGSTRFFNISLFLLRGTYGKLERYVQHMTQQALNVDTKQTINTSSNEA
jgi:hypothetical protein